MNKEDKPAAKSDVLAFITKYSNQYNMDDFLTEESLEEFANVLAVAHPRIQQWLKEEMSLKDIIKAIKKVTMQLNLDFAYLMLLEIEDESEEKQQEVFEDFKRCYE